MALLGGVMGASGAQKQAQAQAANLAAQQQAGEYNAQILMQQSGIVASESVAQSNIQLRQARQVMAKQRAAQAQSNYFGVTSEDLINQSAANIELDRLNILYQGEAKSKGLQSQAALARQGGQVAGAQIGNVLQAGNIQAGSAILGGVGQMGFLAGSGRYVNPFVSWGRI